MFVYAPLYMYIFVYISVSVSIGILVLWWQGVAAILSERQQFPLYAVFATCFRCSTSVAFTKPLDPLCSQKRADRQREGESARERANERAWA